jgi:uncharacterized membrane protein YhaH (DUF805 family)
LRWAKDAFGLEGRLGRLAQIRILLALSLAFAAGLLAVILLLRSASAEAQFAGRSAGLFIAVLWANLAITVKRLHDLDRSGLHAIWVYASSAGALAASGAVRGQGGALAALGGVLVLVAAGISLWLLLAPGTPGPNRFGE